MLFCVNACQDSSQERPDWSFSHFKWFLSSSLRNYTLADCLSFVTSLSPGRLSRKWVIKRHTTFCDTRTTPSGVFRGSFSWLDKENTTTKMKTLFTWEVSLLLPSLDIILRGWYWIQCWCLPHLIAILYLSLTFSCESCLSVWHALDLIRNVERLLFLSKLMKVSVMPQYSR